jgi:dTDP-4-dehydrorhamnose reductase
MCPVRGARGKGHVVKWVITGGSGQLGSALAQTLKLNHPAHEVLVPSRLDMDLGKPAELRSYLTHHRADVVVNCAAWTNVDLAETHEQQAAVINADAPAAMAETLARLGEGVLIQMSTDYVFDGNSRYPYDEDSPVSPLSAYGRTKAAGEEAVRLQLPDRSLVVRTAWLYGGQGRNFVRTILTALDQGSELCVVDDQIGHPSWAQDVAGRVVDLGVGAVGGAIQPGIFHAVNAGTTSWWGFAREIADNRGFAHVAIQRGQSSELDRPAPRPSRVELRDLAALSCDLPEMRSWHSALSASLI